ncbi:MAG: deoxyribodipyrimidine photo-lyase [Alphaproteobacteria bacterium]|nr:deoxyribodipyrimidine photo-lyase [Alphaproteobacteria bacterium]
MTAPVIVWFRDDLRLADNPALHAAAASGRPVVPVFVWDDDPPDGRTPGAAARWWLHGSLAALDAGLGGRLVRRRGRADAVIPDLAATLGATVVHWNRAIVPCDVDRDEALVRRLAALGVTAAVGAPDTLHPPGQVRTRSGGAFRVFTPFWAVCRAQGAPARPLPSPARLSFAPDAVAGLRLDDLNLRPSTPDWASGLHAAWTPGEAAAQADLAGFVEGALADYAVVRDRPDQRGTSRLSPRLRFGELSPRQVWHATATAGDGAGVEVHLRQLGWREFAYHLLGQAPDMARVPLKASFAAFPWRADAAAFRAWRRGRTGYPLVDAGLRELWSTGWMHNRARMVAASFLIKHLLLPWQDGEAWFWDTLVDADPANNPVGWQWVAGSGADAAPFFRVFNPARQAETHDPDGTYTRRWVPELARLPVALLHRPWTAGPLELAAAGVRLGVDYPFPLVDHAAARARALDAYARLGRACG